MKNPPPSRRAFKTSTGTVTAASAAADPGGNDVFEYVAIAPGGDIIAAGTALARYNPDGSLDRSFGGGDGHLELPDGAGNTLRAGGLAVRSDGKILMAYADTRTEGSDNVVSRFNADGSLDTTFGAGGTARLPRDAGRPDQYSYTWDLALAPCGKIVVGGTSVWRLNENGSPDTSFGGGDGVGEPRRPGLQLRQRELRGRPARRPDRRRRRGRPRAILSELRCRLAAQRVGPARPRIGRRQQRRRRGPLPRHLDGHVRAGRRPPA